MLKQSYPYYLANRAVQPNEQLEVTDKYTGEVATRVALADAAAIDKGIAASVEAFEAMCKMPSYARQAVLNHCVQRFTERADELAMALCIEAGKPIKDSRGEVSRLIDTFRIASEESVRIGGEVMDLEISPRARGYRGMYRRVPIGPCSFISPFNFPLNLAAHKVAPALAVGCPFVLKPASRTPIGALMIGEVLAETDLPTGAFSILPCHRDGADLFTTDDRLKLLSFTGSPGVGWRLKAMAGKKKVVLELGGNAACIVDHDADLADVVQRLVFGAFYQSGQSCIGVQRIVVHEKIYDELKQQLVAATRQLVSGDPKDEATFIGPMISEKEAERLESWVRSAVESGGTLLCGGARQGAMLEATLLENVPKDQQICTEEAFGPVAVLSRFSDFDAALRVVNESTFGLQAGVFTRDLYRAQQAWDELDVGGVIIGDVPSWRVDHMPYGGVKDSGLGREGIRFAIDDMTEIRNLVIRTPELYEDRMMLIQLQPYDEHNQKLESNVHPPDWVNPDPDGRYNMVVIGAGTAGLVSAVGAAGLGAKVALIERELMGGDCLNVGCVPSKGVISAARIAAAVRDANEFGVEVPDGWKVNFGAAMERMRRLRAGISRHDAAARFRDLGVGVFIGDGKFTGGDVIEVAGKQLQFKRAVIATGARAAELPIPGLKDVDYLTNESIFSLTELPARLTVIGGGPIGTEMAQTFARFGSQVTQIEKSAHILFREERDAALIVQQAMEKDGVNFALNAVTKRVEQRGSEKVVVVEQDGEEKEIVGDQLLIGIGRSPNVEGMGLENAGVRFDVRKGVEVNDRLQTTNPAIFAAGDVCSKFKFTHAADFMARIVIQNALFRGRAKASALTIPWATYTSPELAHVGINSEEAKSRGIEIDIYTQTLDGVDRAILEGDQEGFVRVYTKKGTDTILGATIVAANAGDMISEITLAMAINSRIPNWKKKLRLARGVGLGAIGSTIHPYPTQAEAIRKLGDQYSRTRLTPLVKSLFARWLAWTR